MIVTFPHLGNSYLAVKAILDSLDIPYIIPDLNSKVSLDTGCKISPEEICLPFKLMIGNIINAIEKGADTVIIPGSCGPCRFGEYCELQMQILKNLNINVKFVLLDPPSEIGKEEFLRRIKIISSISSKSKGEKLKALLNGYKIINTIEEIEKDAKYLSGYEIKKGQCIELVKIAKLEAYQSNSAKEMLRILEFYKKKLKEVKIDKNKKPLKIAIIGEIYTIIEPYSNINIEEKLMKEGISLVRKITPSWWLKDILLNPLGLNSNKIRTASSKYIPYPIGGFSKECIGEAILAAKEGCDGAIQIFPMGCMPEIVSKSILPSVSNDLNFPILSLIMDEITGDAGYNTRIEAFIDLLERRKKNVSFGN